MNDDRQLAQRVAPEDLSPGDYVCVMHVLKEPSFLDYLCDVNGGSRPRHVAHLPEEGALPLRVLDVCLPFVLVNDAKGEYRMLDMRRETLARVSRRYGRLAFARLGGWKARSPSSGDSEQS